MDESETDPLDELFERFTGALLAGETFDVDTEAERFGVPPNEAAELARTARLGLDDRLVRTPPTLAGFDLEREIGRGAMGVVWLARERAMGDRPVALKLLPSAALLDDRARERFLTEARALARVRSPWVVAVHAVVEEGGGLAYAMEWVDGESLSDVVRHRFESGDESARTRASGLDADDYVPWVVRSGVSLARALEAVHVEGMLHRDVKPSNVLVDTELRARLSDFGLVKSERARLLTRSGAFLGTPAFAAPEQLRGEGVDARADVYGLGATLFRALTGRLPFASTSEAALVREIEASGPPMLRDIDRTLPRDLERVVAMAMEPDRGRRYRDASALREDLERVLALRPVAARPLGPVARRLRALRRHRQLGVGLALGALVVGAVIGATVVWRVGEQHRLRRAADELRAARVTLLGTRPDARYEQASQGTDAGAGAEIERVMREAVQYYERSLEFVRDQPTARAERDAIAAALDDGAAPTELRARGLFAFSSGRVDDALDVWRDWDFARGEEVADPFIEGLIGIAYLVDDRPALALPRLLDASRAYGDVYALDVGVSEAALGCGDLATARRAVARVLERDDVDARKRRVLQLQLDWLSGETVDGDELAPLDDVMGALVAEANGRLEEALTAYVNADALRSELRVRRALLRAARAWWPAASESKRRELDAALRGELRTFGSLFGLLERVNVARRTLARHRDRITPFQIDADPVVFDAGLDDERAAPGSIDHAAMRYANARLDPAACARLTDAERAEIVEAWLDSDPAVFAEFAASHDLELAGGQSAFGPSPLSLPPGSVRLRELAVCRYVSSEFWRRPLVVAGDFDGDGARDVIAYSAPHEDGGRATVSAWSAASGRRIFTIEGEFTALAAAPDANGDGVPDWVGAVVQRPGRVGSVELRSGVDGALLHGMRGGEEDFGFGNAVAAYAGADGRVRVAVSSPRESHGRVEVRDGDRLVAAVRGAVPGDQLGMSIEVVGDIDADGWPDLAVGSEPTRGSGAYVLVLSGEDARVLREYGGDDLRLGWRARPGTVGDVDGDGVVDVAIGCFPVDENGRRPGRVIVVSGTDGSTLLELAGDAPHGGFGENVTGFGGTGLVAVTSWGTRALTPPSVRLYDRRGRQVAEVRGAWRLDPCTDAEPFVVAATRLDGWSRFAPGGLGGNAHVEVIELSLN